MASIFSLITTFSIYLFEEHNLDENYAGYLYSLTGLASICSISVINRWPYKVNSKFALFLGILIQAAMFLIQGPAPFLNFSNSLASVIIIRIA
jgi:predicted MFS family arabinose efflux permease